MAGFRRDFSIQIIPYNFPVFDNKFIYRSMANQNHLIITGTLIL